MINHNEETKNFLKRVGATVQITFVKIDRGPAHWNDRNFRNIYKVVIRRKGKQYTYTFYDSVFHTNRNIKPSEYDVLSCLTKYDVGSFEEFCSEYGYEIYNDYGRTNSTSKKIYNAVVKEFENVERIFGDVLEEFAETCC